MSAPRPTIRSIAAKLGLSRSTVSNALRGHTGVAEETRRQVEALATELGYNANPFASEVMSQLRSHGSDSFLGTLGVLEIVEPDRPDRSGEFHQDLVEGVRKRASEIGFSISCWSFGDETEVSPSRMSQILEWRGIRGLILLPVWGEADFSGLNWSSFAGVYLDFGIKSPSLHSVCTDHFGTVFRALEKVAELGYRRPGIAIPKRDDARVHGRRLAAYFGYVNEHPELELLKPLAMDGFEAEPFLSWFESEKPDVVLTHFIDGYAALLSAGVRVPEDCGFLCLNLQTAPSHFSGFHLSPKAIGERGVELIVSQLSHNDRGAPAQPSMTVVPSTWREGATLIRRV